MKRLKFASWLGLMAVAHGYGWPIYKALVHAFPTISVLSDNARDGRGLLVGLLTGIAIAGMVMLIEPQTMDRRALTAAPQSSG